MSICPFLRYATNSVEIQLRQLGDLAFLTQNYEVAYQSYHHVKKDFQSASAWNYYAAAVVSRLYSYRSLL